MTEYTLVILIDSTQQNVLMMRKSHGPYPGLLNFPGGRVEETDNDVLRAAAREVLEETGIKLTRLTGLTTQIMEMSMTRLYTFYTVLPAGTEFVQNADEPLEWLPVDEVLSFKNMSKYAGDCGYLLQQALNKVRNHTWL